MAVWMRYPRPGGRVTAHLLRAMCLWLVVAGDVTRAESIVPAELNCYLRARAGAGAVEDVDTGWNEVYAHAETTPERGASASMHCVNYIDGNAQLLGWAGSSGSMTWSVASTYLIPGLLTIGTSVEVPAGTPLLLRVALYGQSGFNSIWSFDLRRGSTYLVSQGGMGNEVSEIYEVEIYAGEALTPSAYVESGGHEGYGAYVSVNFTVLPEPATLAPLDIRSGSCPNPLNRSSHGVLPAAVLGTVDFDVTSIDLSSVRLSRADGVGGSVAPHEGPPGPHSTIDDVGTPFDGEPCDCHELGGDGFDDLSLKFKVDSLVSALELHTLPPDTLVELVVSGQLDDGSRFVSRDCVRLVPPVTPPARLIVESTSPNTWIDIEPLDFLLDGGGFANPSFERVFLETTLVTATAAPSFAGGGFFVGWEVDGEMTPDLTVAVTVVDTQTIKAMYTRPGDFDLDDDVDLSDFVNLGDCFTGPVPPSDPGPGWQECRYVFDSDADGDVDLSDFAMFQANCAVQR